ncbi:MAG: hypothetical protein K6G25_12915 [Bacteroidales bacterium]|nr:hypothetical protein [Bacteroidales bacterium]
MTQTLTDDPDLFALGKAGHSHGQWSWSNGFQLGGIGDGGLFAMTIQISKKLIFSRVLWKMCIFAPKVGWKMCVEREKLGRKMCFYV